MARRRRERGRAGATQPVPGYLDLQPIAQGGFSVVYRAFQESFNRTVALKVLEVDLGDPTAQATFWAECAATGRLTGHPNIVTVLDSGLTTDGRPYLTVDYYERGSLADRLRSEGPLPVDEVLRVGIKISGALETAHSSGILHRDVKPQNILMSQFGEPALADFGIAAFDAESAARVAGALTPVHAAPEVLAGQPASRSSDVYSLGSTLYLLLAGRAPHESRPGESLDALQRRVVTEPVGDISRPDVPSMITDVLRKMLAAEPSGRYPSALDAGMALRDLQRQLGHARTDLLVPASVQGPRPGQDEVIALRQEAAARALPGIEPRSPGAPGVPGVPDGKRSLPPLPPEADRLEINLTPWPPPPVPGSADSVDRSTAGRSAHSIPTRTGSGAVPPGAVASPTVARAASPVAEQLLAPPERSLTGRWIAIAALVVAAVAVAALAVVLSSSGGDSGSNGRESGPSNADDSALPAASGTEPSEATAVWSGDELLVSWKYDVDRDQLARVEILDAAGRTRSPSVSAVTFAGQTSTPFTATELAVPAGTSVCAEVLAFYKADDGFHQAEPVEACTVVSP